LAATLFFEKSGRAVLAIPFHFRGEVEKTLMAQGFSIIFHLASKATFPEIVMIRQYVRGQWRFFKNLHASLS
jgi:hypothetical protein